MLVFTTMVEDNFGTVDLDVPRITNFDDAHLHSFRGKFWNSTPFFQGFHGFQAEKITCLHVFSCIVRILPMLNLEFPSSLHSNVRKNLTLGKSRTLIPFWIHRRGSTRVLVVSWAPRISRWIGRVIQNTFFSVEKSFSLLLSGVCKKFGEDASCTYV